MTDAAAIRDRLQNLPTPTLKQLFDADPQRLSALTGRIGWGEGETAGSILFDWSKTHLDEVHMGAFEELADAMDFAGRRDVLLTGGIANPTEGRSAQHTADPHRHSPPPKSNANSAA